MEITKLDWDSHFFNKRIGKLEFGSLGPEEELMEVLKKQNNFDLVYVFCDPDVEINPSDLHSRFFLADHKIDFHKRIIKISESVDYQELDFIKIEAVSQYPDVYTLALESGLYSRFKKDPGFSEQDYENLYKTWVEESIHGNMADICIGCIIEDQLVGFSTLKFDESHSRIGLFAVSPLHRGKNIGSLLIKKTEEWARNKGYDDIFVATQKTNERACHFYKKNNFLINKEVKVYHYWY
ncbi:MAG: GNAT family N-acetyltransferase [Cyclobacteriaceae bacterium]|nr:GNAT family N-acetyltransferase [Cyclobacteriaceae bacterium]